MIKPITCSQCKSALAWYDTYTGCLKNDSLPYPVFGAFLPCPECYQVYRFDGMKLLKKAKNKERATNQQTVTESKSESFLAGLTGLNLAY